MGFADYISRNPSGKPTAEIEDEEKFVIKTMHEIKHAWLKHIIEPTTTVKPTGNYIHPLDVANKQNKMTSHTISKTGAEKNTLFALTHSKISCLVQLKILLLLKIHN